MKVLAPTYFKEFTCKCKECRNSCCKNWRIDVHADDIERLKKLNDPSIDSFIVIDKKETNDGFIQKDGNKCCLFIDTDGLCKIQKKYGEQALPKVCRHYPKNIFKNGGTNHLAFSNGCEKTIELLSNINSFNLETIEYDFGKDPVSIFDSNLDEKLKEIIDLLNDNNHKLSDILINSFCSQIQPNNTNTNYDIKLCFNFLLSISYNFATHKPSLVPYHNNIINRLRPDSLTPFDKYLLAKTEFEANHPNNDRFLKNILCNYVFYSHLFTKPVKNESWFYMRVCVIYIIIKFITTVNFYNTNDMDKYIDCIAAYFRTIQSSNKINPILSALKASGLDEKHFLESLLKWL